MSVQARFYVSRIEKTTTDYGTVHLNAATRGSINAEWAYYSPSGSIQMNVRQDSKAFAWFESRLGKDVAISFDDRDFSEDADIHGYNSDGSPRFE